MIRRFRPSSREQCRNREWLVTNGLGGYAMGMLAEPPARRYHGWLTAALPPPWGRVVVLGFVQEILTIDGQRYCLDDHLPEEIRLDWGLPIWRWRLAGCTVERRLILPHGENALHAQWRCLDGPDPFYELIPWLALCPHAQPADRSAIGIPRLDRTPVGDLIVNASGLPALSLSASNGIWSGESGRLVHPLRIDRDGGGDATIDLWSPARLNGRLTRDGTSMAVRLGPLSTEANFQMIWNQERTRRRLEVKRADPALRHGSAAEMIIAADGFRIAPPGRGADARSLIAGYPWFSDWGRDTMIALEGLTLLTGHGDEAAAILRTFAAHERDGLIPNQFPDGQRAALYHAADASLWFIHACARHWRMTGEHETLAALLPSIERILHAYRHGTRFGIAVDPRDHLLTQGDPDHPLTWMDAQTGDWVVTPRRGKAVELNALWFNALMAAAELRDVMGQDGTILRGEAEVVGAAFNRRFWNPARRCLFDVVDGETGDDPSVRPNQILAIALPHPVLSPRHWRDTMATVKAALATSQGLRSLAPDDPAFRPVFFGGRLDRDGAYHQGTVWAWLVGAFVSAWIRAYPDDPAPATAMVNGLARQIGPFGMGWLGEIFDAIPPHTPRGCPAQAWSVAEWLRARVLLAQSGADGQNHGNAAE